jgi:hypothetical protein
MVNRDELIIILDRISDRQQTDKDIATLRQLFTDNAQALMQVSKFNINIGQGQDIHIGDRIYQGLDAESIHSVIASVLEKRLVYETSNQDDISLSIAVSNVFTVESYEGYGLTCSSERTLSYQLNRLEQQLHIQPCMDYLLALAKGGPIFGLEYILNIPPYFKWQFPNLDLRIVNNSNKTIYITDVVFEVEKSVFDPYPILVIPGEEPNYFHFILQNEGWGEVQDAFVRFNLVSVGQPIFTSETYQHEVQVGTFLEQCNVNLSDALEERGVNIQFLAGVNQGKPEYASIRTLMGRFFGNFETFEENIGHPEYQRLMDALGSFANSKSTRSRRYSAVAYGEISFTGTTIEGHLKQDKVKFSTEIPLLILGGYGAPSPPTYQYGVWLDVDRENYQAFAQDKGSSVSQYLRAGDIDRFNIRVGVSKSSFHTFRLRLIYNNEQSLFSPPIALHIFVPRSEGKELKRAETP